jgi:uncharacterized protein YdiU (UPF0061 family)
MRWGAERAVPLASRALNGNVTGMTTSSTTLDRPALFSFDNSYARLPPQFHARRDPMPVADPRLLRLNDALARELGLDPVALASPEGVQVLAGNRLPEGAASVALAYAGHQFGHFVPRLGDGRAVLLGEVVAPDGSRHDIQLKGSGRTQFSRGGDGRAAVGPVLREYLVSEAMAALGIPTTRALAAVTTGEGVWRDMELPGAVLTRVAASHIRVGTFQYFAATGDVDALRLLVDHAVQRHDPEAARAPDVVRAFLDGVVKRQAELVARWLLVGFIHGVMNTDNCSVSGETIDYGPCAFLDDYDPGKVFSSIDHAGRYAYGEQPRIAQWNVTRLAETLLPLLGETEDAALESARAALNGFAGHFEAAYVGGLRRKLGLVTAQDGDRALAQDFLALLTESGADFTNSFRRLCDAAADLDLAVVPGDGWEAWATRWRERLAAEPMDGRDRRASMQAVNPWVIPRNHQVEACLVAAMRQNDLGPFERMLAVLSAPFTEQPGQEHYIVPPTPDQQVTQTFCGT